MKRVKKIYIKMALTMLALLPSQGLMAAAADSLAFTYQQFVNQKGIQRYEGYFTIYKQDNRYWIEIPQEAMERDILITCQAVKGYTNYLSPASDVVTLQRHNLHKIYLRKHRSLDYQRDTLNASIMGAIRNSNLVPVDRVLNIVSLGKDGKSYIVDITQDICTANGLFDVSQNSSLNHPDPNRSGWIGMQPIQEGCLMEVYRSQTDIMPVRSMNDRQEVANTVILQMVMQVLPAHKHSMQEANPAYGFETITRQEYDSKNHLSRRKNYITTWDFESGPITLYIDPDMPEAFRTSVRQAVDAWTSTLKAAGIHKPFVYATPGQAHKLAYKCLSFVWGNALNGINSTKVIDPTTGEILTARINVLDRMAEELYEPYYILFRNIDTRVKKDFMSLGMRQNFVASGIMAEMGKVLGMKQNYRGRSVTQPLKLNYAATDKTPLAALFPTIADYDRLAMKFAYGRGKQLPVLTDYYSAEDERDPYATKNVLSANVLADSRRGIALVKHSYASLIEDLKLLPSDQLNMQAVSHLAMQHLALYNNYLVTVAKLIGGRSNYPIIRGISEQPVVFVPRITQQEALEWLEKEILTGFPAWLQNAEVQRVCTGNMYSMSIGTANDVVKALLNANVLLTLAEAERTQGADQAFTAKELTDFINRILFCNFNESTEPSDYQRKMQITAMLNVADYVQEHNVVTGMQNEGNCILQVYLVQTYRQIAHLAIHHALPDIRSHYAMLKMRLDRAYFKKKI